MLNEEWLDRFDLLYNNVTSNQAPGLNLWEICVFLTKAQDEILKNYFLPQSNPKQAGFDDNQKRQIDFSTLTSAKVISDSLGSPLFDMRENSRSVTLPEDVMMIINEMTNVYRDSKSIALVTVPLKYDEYARLMSKPFKRPVKNQAWRLINHNVKNSADLIVGPSDTIVSYVIRYIRQPKPIIVGDLDGLTINGYTFGTGEMQTEGCELDPMLHEEILQRAVELAKISWTATGNDNIQAVLQAGQRSE